MQPKPFYIVSGICLWLATVPVKKLILAPTFGPGVTTVGGFVMMLLGTGLFLYGLLGNPFRR